VELVDLRRLAVMNENAVMIARRETDPPIDARGPTRAEEGEFMYV